MAHLTQAAEEAAEAKQAEAKTSKTDAKPEVLIDPRYVGEAARMALGMAGCGILKNLTNM